MQDDLRAELIKQFPADVVEIIQPDGTRYYACPTCKRPVALGDSRCGACGQVLSWEHLRKEEERSVGVKTATLSFEVAGDFTNGDCRKCPLSYISKLNEESIYQCPLNMRANCKLEIS